MFLHIYASLFINGCVISQGMLFAWIGLRMRAAGGGPLYAVRFWYKLLFGHYKFCMKPRNGVVNIMYAVALVASFIWPLLTAKCRCAAFAGFVDVVARGQTQTLIWTLTHIFVYIDTHVCVEALWVVACAMASRWRWQCALHWLIKHFAWHQFRFWRTFCRLHTYTYGLLCSHAEFVPIVVAEN